MVTQVEQSKRLDDQATSIKILNDAHVNNEVAHAQILEKQKTIDSKIASLNGKIDDYKISFNNTIKYSLTIISIFCTLLGIILNYVIN